MTGEEELKSLLGSLGFNVFVFDEGDDKSGITIQRTKDQEPCEIDAIAIHENVIILINAYRGLRSRKAFDKIPDFFRQLRYLDTPDKLNLVVSNQKLPAGNKNLKSIGLIKDLIQKSSYDWLLIKLAFSPNVHIPIGKIELNNQEIIFDKKHNDYFGYGIENIGGEYMRQEFLYFLKIKMREFKRLKGSRVGDEPELTADFQSIETKLNDNQTMYSTSVSVSDIIPYIQVLRVADEYNEQAFQRMINGEIIKRISNEYLNKNKSFPNNIILAFNPDIYNHGRAINFAGAKRIKFYKEFGSLIVIDGQHRLLAHLLEKNRDYLKSVLVNVILFETKDRAKAFDQMAELFYLINTKQKKLTSLVSLRIRSKIIPSDMESIWYRVFEKLNNMDQRDNYLFEKISFDEKEIRKEKNGINISSIISYSGLKRISNGVKKGKKNLIGLKDIYLQQVVFKNEEQFYENFVRKYFSIIGEIIDRNTKMAARDFGGLLRIAIHFLNDSKTKDVFKNFALENNALPTKIVEDIKSYFIRIPFNKLDQLEYGANAWAIMEGFFLGNIRKHHRGFGISSLLSKKGQAAMKKGKKF